MTILIPRGDKARAIDLLEQVLKLFVFPGITTEQSLQLINHLDRMRRQPKGMNFKVRLETIPKTEETIIIISTTPEHKPHATH